VARCAKLIETCPKRPAAVTAAKGGSTSIDFGGVNSYARSSFQVFLSCLFHNKNYFASSKW
jgi:hypothetical protein